MLLAEPKRGLVIIPNFESIRTEQVHSFYHFITSLASTNAIAWFKCKEAEIGYTGVFISELRPDYLNKEIYFPIHRYNVDKETGFTYNHRLEKRVIHSSKDGWKESSLLVQSNPFISSEVVKYELSKSKMQSEYKDAQDLFDLYIPFSYGYHKIESDYAIYDEVKASKISKRHRQFLRDTGLSFYGDYLNMEYNRFRGWNLIELNKRLPYDKLHIEERYNERRIKFELEVYLGLLGNVYWDGWTKGNFNELLSDKRSFVKYKERGIYLIFSKFLIKR